MQLVLSNNRVIAHGENFLVMGSTVINTETGKKHENATVAECDNCPSDIGKVGYEYHAGVFVPCAPYGKGIGNIMVACQEDCGTPKDSGVPLIGGIKLENLNEEVTAKALGGSTMTLLWENASPSSTFGAQNITFLSGNYTYLIIEYSAYSVRNGENKARLSSITAYEGESKLVDSFANNTGTDIRSRGTILEKGWYTSDDNITYDRMVFTDCYTTSSGILYDAVKPLRIYGVTI